MHIRFCCKTICSAGNNDCRRTESGDAARWWGVRAIKALNPGAGGNHTYIILYIYFNNETCWTDVSGMFFTRLAIKSVVKVV